MLNLKFKPGLSLSLLLAVFTWVGCMDKDEQPDDLIPERKMREILIDMHYADAYAFQEFRADSVYRAATGMYLDIFEKHGVDTATFHRSFRYYTSRPQRLDKMYQAMIDTLNARESRLRGDVQE